MYNRKKITKEQKGVEKKSRKSGGKRSRKKGVETASPREVSGQSGKRCEGFERAPRSSYVRLDRRHLRHSIFLLVTFTLVHKMATEKLWMKVGDIKNVSERNKGRRAGVECGEQASDVENQIKHKMKLVAGIRPAATEKGEELTVTGCRGLLHSPVHHPGKHISPEESSPVLTELRERKLGMGRDFEILCLLESVLVWLDSFGGSTDRELYSAGSCTTCEMDSLELLSNGPLVLARCNKKHKVIPNPSIDVPGECGTEKYHLSSVICCGSDPGQFYTYLRHGEQTLKAVDEHVFTADSRCREDMYRRGFMNKPRDPEAEKRENNQKDENRKGRRGTDKNREQAEEENIHARLS
ncbi:hypothetical protein CCH79_00006125 [Gambusia affinis]|uniref:Uncharacterized protein n=1 Tax=Gambusia affinis TaxID=33528 RepID=A0A315WB60_GAMAF|nr:hypothetical protein CCH79_00006125 [Gambusia affinis]